MSEANLENLSSRDTNSPEKPVTPSHDGVRKSRLEAAGQTPRPGYAEAMPLRLRQGEQARGDTFMSLALEQARLASERGEVPVGAVIVHENRIIASSHNRIIELNDPTAHAELLAIREACRTLGSPRLTDCDLYVTLEPCAMCAQAMAFARIRRLYFGASDPKGGGVEHGARVFAQPTCHHRPEIYGGIEAAAGAELLKQFFIQRRVNSD